MCMIACLIACVQHVLFRPPLKSCQVNLPPTATAHPTTMLLWITLLCLLSANVVTSQFTPPGILADYDPNTTLRPLKNNLKNKHASESTHFIRGLLMVRQSGCSDGYTRCTDPAGRLALQLLSPRFPSRFRVPSAHVFIVFICTPSIKHERSQVLNMKTMSHRCCPQDGSCCQTDGKPDPA